MSIWIEIKDKDDVELSNDGKSVEVLYQTDDTGNYYIDIPIEFIKSLIKGDTEQ